MPRGKQRGLTAGEWERLFLRAGVRTEELTTAKSSRAKAILIGRFFAPLVGREVPIQVKGRTGRAMLKLLPARSNEKRYYFQIRWDQSVPVVPAEVDGAPAMSEKLDVTEAERDAPACPLAEKSAKQHPPKSSKKGPAAAAARARTPQEATGKGRQKNSKKGNEEKW